MGLNMDEDLDVGVPQLYSIQEALQKYSSTRILDN
jgi:hypothetical protein